ncbi:MAG: histidinol dehydrogenase [Phycisphaeraceae bacterium]|nr:MAG: histidinol dehydrogenase [Phycisphaeraceae bacterium]
MSILRVIRADEVRAASTTPISDEARAAVTPIIAAVRDEGEAGARRYAERFGEVAPGGPLVLDRAELERRASAVTREDFALLSRVAGRITAFARAQLAAIRPMEAAVPGGCAGHTLIPVASAGCYAPGGRYPLPSSVLMGVCTARAAGVERVVVASPNPAPIVCAAAIIAGADEMLALGGAQAIASLAFGLPGAGPGGAGVEPVSIIAGPGNRYVTAAKHAVMGAVGIDMLAGPSELAVLEHGSGVPAAVIAADLIAQAEHDDDARPILVTTSETVAREVGAAVERLLASMPEPNAGTARRAFANGFAAVAPTIGQAIDTIDRLAPEHLEILTHDPAGVASAVRHAGAVFLGPGSAEVFGDYGVGPNHTLPTGASARFAAGLSVFTFLRTRTFLSIQPDADLIADTARLARLEGLEGHARAAESRR